MQATRTETFNGRSLTSSERGRRSGAAHVRAARRRRVVGVIDALATRMRTLRDGVTALRGRERRTARSARADAKPQADRDPAGPAWYAPEGARNGGRGRTRLSCENCETAYNVVAITHAPALAAAVACQRCGAALRWTQDDADRARRATVQAVRSAISAPQRPPYTIQRAEGHERVAAPRPSDRSFRGD
jgi:hypothetical protein